MSADAKALILALRNITHPGEGLCPLCAIIFDSHLPGCPYEAIDAALAVGEGNG